MSTIVVDQKEELVMRLVHYFVTEKNYSPIVVNGVKNEIWLENIDGPYRIIRINSNYIHNDEQFKYDIYKTKSIISQIKKKTLSFKMSTLNIFLDLNDGVKTKETKDIDSISVEDVKDIKKSKVITEAFPGIEKNLLNNEKGIDLIINVTNDINKKTANDNRAYEKIFSPKVPTFTYALIIINILLFLYSSIDGNALAMFANNHAAVAAGQYYRLFTAMFFHVDIIHILCNMYSLYIIGSQVENYLGKGKYLGIYFISGLIGSLFSATFTTNYSVGASGAIFGLMGALLYFGYHYRLFLNSVVRSQIIPLIIVNLSLGFLTPGIDNSAHIGGLIGGYLSTMALGASDKATKQEKINGLVVLILLSAFLVFFMLNQ